MWPTSILNFFEQIPSSTFFLISKLNWIIALSIILCSIYKFQKIGFLKVSEYCAKLWIDRCWNTGSRRRAFLHFVIVNWFAGRRLRFNWWGCLFAATLGFMPLNWWQSHPRSHYFFFFIFFCLGVWKASRPSLRPCSANVNVRASISRSLGSARSLLVRGGYVVTWWFKAGSRTRSTCTTIIVFWSGNRLLGIRKLRLNVNINRLFVGTNAGF